MIKRIVWLVSILVLVFGLGTGAWATSYVGEISGVDSTVGSSVGLTATDGWSGAFLHWFVDDVTNPGHWTYDYHFYTYSEKGISHVITEVSLNFTGNNIKDGTTSGWELQTYGEAQGGSNPGILGDVFGLKWEGLSNVPTTPEAYTGSYWKWTIVTDRAPMWGDFYAKDGVENPQGEDKIDVYAYNTGFGFDTTATIGGGNAYNATTDRAWVLVPDTTSIPEPTTLLLLGFGLIGLAGFRRR